MTSVKNDKLNITQGGLEECSNHILQAWNTNDKEKIKEHLNLMLKKLDEMIPDDTTDRKSTE